MSLINAPISERRKWVFEVANNLYHLQKARFDYVDSNRSRELKLAWELVKKEKGVEYLKAIANTISSFDLNDIATLDNYWKILENAEEDQDFARILSQDCFEVSDPSTITLNNTYIEPSKQTIDQNLVERVINRYDNAKKNGKIFTPIQAIQEILRYSAGFSSFILYNTLLTSAGPHTEDARMVNSQTVPCVLAGLPLRHVKEIEVARSGKILKFRATGSVFLASQEGGEDAVRIDGILVRSEIIYILALWVIFYYGQGKVKEIESLSQELTNPTLIALRAKNADITTFNKRTEKPSYVSHRTVPFVTRHIIIPNTYIETLSFEEKIQFGKGVIGYSILLRTYRNNTEFDVYSTSDSDSIGIVASKANKSLSMYRVIEFFINIAWRQINREGLFIKEQEWRLTEDRYGDDVYYNIDAVDIASTASLALVGVL